MKEETNTERLLDCFEYRGAIYFKYADGTCKVFKKINVHDTWSQLIPEIFDATKEEMLNWHIKQAKKEALNRYSKFLEERGYIDEDWWVEEPHAVDEFLKDE